MSNFFNLLSEIVNHADIKTTRKYLAKSIRTHQQVAEGLFGSNENTRALTIKKPMGQVQNVASDVPSRIKDTLLNSPDLAVRYRCFIAAARYKEDNEVDLSDYCRPELTEKSNLPNRTLQNICFIYCILIVIFLDTWMKKPKQLPHFLGARCPILDLNELLIAVNILSEEVESEFWPSPRECFTLSVLNYNRKYYLRRKLAGARALLRDEGFSNNNHIGSAVLAGRRRGKKLVNSQQAVCFQPEATRESCADV